MKFYSLDNNYNYSNMQLFICHPYSESITFNQFINGEYVVYHDGLVPSCITIDMSNDDICLKYTFTHMDGSTIHLNGNDHSNISMDMFMKICKWETMSIKDKLTEYKKHRDKFNLQMTEYERNFFNEIFEK